jgi:hypothetical protein
MRRAGKITDCGLPIICPLSGACTFLEHDSATLMNILNLLDPDYISEGLLQVAKEARVANFPTDYGSYQEGVCQTLALVIDF